MRHGAGHSRGTMSFNGGATSRYGSDLRLKLAIKAAFPEPIKPNGDVKGA